MIESFRYDIIKKGRYTMKINRVVGQNRLGNYLILYLDPELDKGLNGTIICRKIRLKGFEYETVPSFDSKYMIAWK